MSLNFNFNFITELYNKEIIQEYNFQTKYGNLTIKQMIIPDFSNEPKGLKRLKEEFQNLKAIYFENDLRKKIWYSF